MNAIHHLVDADPAAIAGSRIAVVGYGDAGSAWARNLRDRGHEVVVCTRPGPSAERAAIDGFAHRPVRAAEDADILCLLVPDGVVSTLDLAPVGWALTVVTSGELLASGRFDPNGDVGLLAPKVHPGELRRRALAGDAVASSMAIHHDRTGGARRRLVALADAVGALGGGAIELSPWQEALLSRSVAQALRPELETVCAVFLQTALGHGIPLDAVISQLVDDSCASRSDATPPRRGGDLRRIIADLASPHGLTSPHGPNDGSLERDLRPLAQSHGVDASALVADLRARLAAAPA